MKKEMIPHILTISRILVIPVVMYLFFLENGWALWAILGLYVYACITDFLDGYFARKFNCVSDMGKFLDPIADKLLVTTLLVFLVANQQIAGIHIIAAIIILLREMFVSGLREFMGPKNIQLPVTKLAKWKTTMQMVATCFLIINFINPAVAMIADTLLWIATLLTVVTGNHYFKTALKHMK